MQWKRSPRYQSQLDSALGSGLLGVHNSDDTKLRTAAFADSAAEMSPVVDAQVRRSAACTAADKWQHL